MNLPRAALVLVALGFTPHTTSAAARTPEPGLVFEDHHDKAIGGVGGITWRGKKLFPPPDDPKLDHIAAGHIGALELIGHYADSELHRWVFRANGIDDCSSYGVWVLDVRGASATLRSVLRECINGSVGILRWKPTAQALIVTGTFKGTTLRWAVSLDS